MGKKTKKRERRSRVGRDLVEAFNELAAFFRGEIELEGYDSADGVVSMMRYDTISGSIVNSNR
jgi:putative transcriptional regulator